MVTVMATPGTAAPDGSDTVPTMEALEVWAKATGAIANTAAAKTASQQTICLGMFDSFPKASAMIGTVIVNAGVLKTV